MLRWLALFTLSVTMTHASGAAAVRDTDAADAIVFERYGDLYTVSLDGRSRRLTYTPAWYEGQPAVSPDGHTIAYSGGSRYGRRGYGIWSLPTEGTSRRRITRGTDGSPAWSRDGYSVYFVRSFTNRFGDNCGAIFHAPTIGGKAVRVTRGPLQFEPAVSPADGRVAFTDADYCAGSAGTSLRAVDSAGRWTRDFRMLKASRGSYWQPSWSPDGTRITFSSPDGNGGVFVCDRDGSGLRRVVGSSMKSHEPSWSPDGRWIAFIGGLSDDLHLVRPDGTGLRRLTRTKAPETSPSWFPTS